jgi:hypothetical protein
MQMQQQRQQQYANQMMMNQQNGQPQQFAGQPYQQQMHAGQMPASGAPPTSAAGQYMGGQPGQGYRPPTSSYDEEFARVKAMMMQHPDLIPPPMEVLRISMSQSTANQQSMAMGANAYMQRGNPAMARGGAPGNPAYAQYGNPNMMMGGPQQNAQQAGMMNAARMRAAQMAQQQAQQRGASGRTPGGSSSGDSQAAWQSENDLPLRRKMIGKMYVRVAACMWMGLLCLTIVCCDSRRAVLACCSSGNQTHRLSGFDGCRTWPGDWKTRCIGLRRIATSTETFHRSRLGYSIWQ